MGAEIIIEPEDVWRECIVPEIETMIAVNDAYGIEIYVIDGCICVDADGVTVCSETAYYSEEQCTETVREIYEMYLSEGAVSMMLYDDETAFDDDDELDGYVYGSYSEPSGDTGAQTEDDTENEIDLIDDRERELDDIVYDTLVGIEPGILDEVKNFWGLMDATKDLICEFLYKRYGVSVYRPMYLEDDKTLEFCAYPYPEMELE